MTDAAVALAEAIHDEDDLCNASYVIPFDECATKEWDIINAEKVIEALRKSGWRLSRDPGDTVEMGL